MEKKWDKKWYFVLGLWIVLCVTGIILWATGVLSTTVVEQAPCSVCESRGLASHSDQAHPNNSLEDRIAQAIMRVPVYDPLNVPREDTLRLERDVISELPDMEHLSPSTTSEAYSSMSEMSTEVDLERFIGYVIYINLDRDPGKQSRLEAQVRDLGLDVKNSRLSAIKSSRDELGRLMSHVTCLAKSDTSQRNVLILEDDFQFDRNGSEIEAALRAVESTVGNRWDVILFSQEVNSWQYMASDDGLQVCRVLSSSGFRGYLVNHLYVQRLVLYLFQCLRQFMANESTLVDISELLSEIQGRDMWIGFNVPVGHTTGRDFQYLNTLTHAVNADGTSMTLTLEPRFVQHRVAICHVATGTFNDFVTAVQKDCCLKFLKGHTLEFFLFTDQPDLYGDETMEGATCYVYRIPQGADFGVDRFHYLLMAERQLEKFDYVYSMDVDYRVYQHPPEEDLLCHGVVATQNLESMLSPRETGVKYASNFHGGSAAAYLAMCHALKTAVDSTAVAIRTTRSEEDYLNEYLLLHPPVNALPQSYIFSETCLNEACTEPMCKQLRSHGNVPIMGPVS